MQTYWESVICCRKEDSEKTQQFFEDMCQRYEIDMDFIEKGDRKKPYIKENYGWTYKVNKPKHFNFRGVCNIIDKNEYLGFEIMSPYSHGTSLATKLSSSATMDRIMNMIAVIYLALWRLVTQYCWDDVDARFDGITDTIESIIQNYVVSQVYLEE